MSFVSYAFPFFLILSLLLYYLLPTKCQGTVLLLSGLLFYSWISPVLSLFLIAVTVPVYIWSNFFAENNSKAAFYFFLILTLIPLITFKYTHFILTNIEGLSGFFSLNVRFSIPALILPMGISFYTFKAISYLIDAERNTIRAEKNFFKLLLFVSFFPELIQGPISRYSDLSMTLYEEHKFNWTDIISGTRRILFGFFKKLIIADRIFIAVNTVFMDDVHSGAYIFFGMLMYVIRLYADFSGGIDICIGAARLFGIEVKENFKQPFFSRTLKEYWRRWHITMGSWFRAYIFYPVSTSSWMLNVIKFFRKKALKNSNKPKLSALYKRVSKRLPVYIATLTAWLATGIWHGASWNFVAWGLSNCVILIISEELEPFFKAVSLKLGLQNKALFRIFQSVRTFLIIAVLNLFDCTRSVRGAFFAFISMLRADNWSIFFDGSLLKLGINSFDYMIIFIAVFTVFCVDLFMYKMEFNKKNIVNSGDSGFINSAGFNLALIYILLFSVLIFGVYGRGYEAGSFIYNRF